MEIKAATEMIGSHDFVIGQVGGTRSNNNSRCAFLLGLQADPSSDTYAHKKENKMAYRCGGLKINQIRELAAKKMAGVAISFEQKDYVGIAIALGKPSGGGLKASIDYLVDYFQLSGESGKIKRKRNVKAKKKTVSITKARVIKPPIPSLIPDLEFVKTADFLQSYEWRKIRLVALKLHGRRCLCCGATPETGAVMNVDHIKPRKTHPSLALDINNLQVLCHECNHGKGNWDTTDFRK